MTELSKNKVYGHLLAGIAGSSPAGTIDVFAMCCTVKQNRRTRQDKQDKEKSMEKVKRKEFIKKMDVCLL